MKHWKTSLSGLVVAACGFVAFSPSLFSKWPVIVELSKYVMLGGLASMGLSGADSDKTAAK